MGQKVNPIGFRIGINKDWNAHWYAKANSDYRKFLSEDLNIKRYISKRLEEAGISKVVIDRASDRLSVNIYTGKPGIVIGRKGQEVEALKKGLLSMLPYRDININVIEVKVPETDAALVAQNLARRLEQRVSHKRAMKRAVETAIKMGAKGIKIHAKGRLLGAEIARKEWYMRGRVPLQTLRADIDYGEATAFTKYGTIGVKVWIYKGDVLGKSVEEEE